MSFLTRRSVSWLAALALLVLAGCKESDDPSEGGEEKAQSQNQSENEFEFDENGYVKRPQMTQAECEAVPGRSVPDSGGGDTAKPEYRCADGRLPLGYVVPTFEGAVCCAL
jgi:hypothetical protein